jgi:hypothetical protein
MGGIGFDGNGVQFDGLGGRYAADRVTSAVAPTGGHDGLRLLRQACEHTWASSAGWRR